MLVSPGVTSGQGGLSECDGVSSPSSDKDSWILCRFADSLGFYGLSFQVEDFGLNVYLTQLIFGAVEVPGRLLSLFMMQWFGRRWSQSGTLVLGGLMCILIIFIPAGTKADSPLTTPTLIHLWPEAHCSPFWAESIPVVQLQMG